MDTKEAYTKRLLKQLAISPARVGYYYLTEAICMVAKDIRCLDGVVNKVYAPIADKYGAKMSSVERAMRLCVHDAQTNAPAELLDVMFMSTARHYAGKLTLKCFIATAAEYARDEVDI